MAPSRHKAIVAGLALTLSLGTVAAPAAATLSNESPTTDTDPNGMGMPLPGGYNKADFYQGTEGVATFARSRSASRLAPVTLSAEMKYFAEFESHSNYDQGLSPYDGYNALGYYQLDRRYALGGFMQQVYDYDPVTYSMFAGPLAKRSVWADENWDPYDYTTKQLKAEAQELDAAWHAAYNANPAEFAALQDGYMYNNYYLPAQSTLLNTYGVDIRNRADCVKGLVWGMTNMFGQGGVEDYFRDAKLSNSMTDRELVTALCDTVVERVVYYCSSQPEYWEGWQNRYRAEKEICLGYIAEDEAQTEANKPQPAPQPTPPTAERPQQPSQPSQPNVSVPQGNSGAGEPGAGDPLPSDPLPGGSNDVDGNPKPSAPSTGNNAAGGTQQNTPASPQTPSGNNAAGGTTAPQSNGSTTNSPNAQPPAQTPPASNTQTGGQQTGGAQADNSTTTESTDNTQSEQTPSTDSTTTNTQLKTESETNTNKAESESATTKQDEDELKQTTTEDESTQGDSNSTSDENNQKTEDNGGASGALPQTGDIAGLVLTGAAGLAAAGASFIQLGKLDGKRRDEDA